LQEHKEILRQAKALGLKLSDDGQSWIPIDTNSVNESVADFGASESLDSGMKSELKIGSLALNYFALFAVIGLTYGIATWSTTINDDIFLFFCTLLIIPTIYAFIVLIKLGNVSNKLGNEFSKGIVSSILISLPISIWSYLNELEYGCFCLFSCSCPPKPDHYEYPLFSAAIMAGLILIYSIALQIKGKRARGLGVFVGLIISFVIFMAATVIGFWS